MCIYLIRLITSHKYQDSIEPTIKRLCSLEQVLRRRLTPSPPQQSPTLPVLSSDIPTKSWPTAHTEPATANAGHIKNDNPSYIFSITSLEHFLKGCRNNEKANKKRKAFFPVFILKVFTCFLFIKNIASSLRQMSTRVIISVTAEAKQGEI